jgi:hypothetical protein
MYSELHGASSQEDEDEDEYMGDYIINYFDLNGYHYRISEHDEDGVNCINLCLFTEEDEVLIKNEKNVVKEEAGKEKVYDDDDDDDEEDGHKKKRIRTMMKRKNRKTLGTLDGKVVRRGINFDMDMDSISQEMCDAMKYFDIMGKVGEEICSLLGKDSNIIEEANGDYLLYVEEMRVVDKERGKDLSLHLIEAFFSYFNDDFSLCMLFPGPLSNDHNWHEDGDSKEEIEKKHREQRDKVITKLGRHFARLGFRQIDKNGYWIVNKPIIPPLPKSETAELEVLLDHPSCLQIVKLDEKVEELRNVMKSSYPSVSSIKQLIDNHNIAIDMINKSCIFHYAVANEHMDILNYLINLGIDINYLDDMGNGPLHVAASCGRYNSGIKLIHSGANKNLYNSEGKLPKKLLQETIASIKRTNRCFNLPFREETSYKAFSKLLA